MIRILIVVAALVALLACGAVAYVALHHAAPEPAVTTTEIETPAVPAKPLPVAAKPEPAAPAPVMTPAPAPVSATSAAAPEKSPLTRDQLAELVNNLSPDDLAKLDAAANKRARARQADENKYHLPSDTYLKGKKLNLSPDQEQKIKALKDAMKPLMEPALGEIHAQFSQWETRSAALWNNVTLTGQRDPDFQAKVLAESAKYNDIIKLQTALLAPLDQQYLTQVRQILSPDQQQTFDADAAAAADAAEKQKQKHLKWNTGGGMFGP